MSVESPEAAVKTALAAGGAVICIAGALELAKYATGEAIVAGAALPALWVFGLMLAFGAAWWLYLQCA